jgi:carotenoid cleavage dioxygenase
LDGGSLDTLLGGAPAGAAPSGKPDAEVVPAAATPATPWWSAANWATWLLHRALALLSRPQTTIYLQGSYAPVAEELHERDLEVVTGALPRDLAGAYVRVGPNPALKPVAGYHWFDGDGMAHAVRVKGGKASYSNRYVETNRRALERQAGYAVFGKIGDVSSAASLSCQAKQKTS